MENTIFESARKLETAGRFAEAIACYYRHLGSHPSDAAAINNIANCHLSLGELHLAESCFRKAVELDPSTFLYSRNLGLVLARLKNLPQATIELERALCLNRDDAEVHFLLAAVLGERDRPWIAHPYIMKAIRLKPLCWQAWCLLVINVITGVIFTLGVAQPNYEL